jgi:hypothetical protein
MKSKGLLTDEEFQEQLWRYTLGSFPLGWERAKKKILADRQARIRLQQEMENASPELEQEMTQLLLEAYSFVPEGDLHARITSLLEKLHVRDSKAPTRNSGEEPTKPDNAGREDEEKKRLGSPRRTRKSQNKG